MQSRCRWLLVAALAAASGLAVGQESYQSHPPMRPLPAPRQAPLAGGERRFVDAARGDDAAAGSEPAPWKTLGHAWRQLAPGTTLYLRGGTYYERVSLTRSGTADAPIVIAS